MELLWSNGGGEGSVGIVSIHDSHDRNLYGSNSQLHIGWKGDSYGYHNDDGCVFVSNPTTVHQHWNQFYWYWKIRYGPIWGTTTDNINNNDNNTDVRPNGADPRETHPREEYEDRNNNHESKHNLLSVVGCGYNNNDDRESAMEDRNDDDDDTVRKIRSMIKIPTWILLQRTIPPLKKVKQAMLYLTKTTWKQVRISCLGFFPYD